MTCICGQHEDFVLPMSGRRAEAELNYQCQKNLGGTIPLDQEPRLLQWKHWYLIANRFPYNMIFAEHDMLLPLRGFANRGEMSVAEFIEYNQIIDELSNQYDLVFENFNHRRSVLGLFHIHLARYHPKRENIKL